MINSAISKPTLSCLPLLVILLLTTSTISYLCPSSTTSFYKCNAFVLNPAVPASVNTCTHRSVTGSIIICRKSAISLPLRKKNKFSLQSSKDENEDNRNKKNKDDKDDKDKSSSSNDDDLLTNDELLQDPELSQLESIKSRQRRNKLFFLDDIAKVINVLAYAFVISSVCLQFSGYGYVLDPNNVGANTGPRIIGTNLRIVNMENKAFILEMTGKDVAAEKIRSRYLKDNMDNNYIDRIPVDNAANGRID
jgi:hypothetical protein